MNGSIVEKPATFDRIDRIKEALGETPLPGDDGVWILGQPMVFEIDSVTHTVPRGFTTDGASIPKIGIALTGWKRWDEPQRWAAIAHDWLYTRPNTAKQYADLAFRALLISEKASWWMRNVMYLAVRLFGGPAYRADQLHGPMIYP